VEEEEEEEDLWRCQSGMFQIQGFAQAKLELESCVFITAVPITKMKKKNPCGRPRPLAVTTKDVCVFITVGPSTKLFAWGGIVSILSSKQVE
jgi:hypothetical protein